MKQVQLFQGDCIELMKVIPDGSIDAIIADLPYGTTQNQWDSIIPLDALWEQYKRICHGAIVLTASQPFTSTLVMSNISMFGYEWIWEKNKASGHLNAKRIPMKSHESVIVFYNAPTTYNPQMTDNHKAMNPYYTSNNGKNYGDGKIMSGGGSTKRYPRSVQMFPVVNNDDPEKIHPTQKPVALMEYLIKTYTNENEVVLDNCMGSGTTGVACLNTNRKFIGMEQDHTYFELASKRINDKIDEISKKVF